MPELTVARLHELLNYDPESGAFRWRQSGPGRRKDLSAGWVSDDGYRMIEIEGSAHLEHRLAWLYVHGTWVRELDHRDENKENNAIGNLRPCTRAQNIQNIGLTASNTSGFKGAFLRPSGRWMARIRVSGRLVCLGDHSTAREAAIAYDKAAVSHFGEFAKTNKMLGLL